MRHHHHRHHHSSVYVTTPGRGRTPRAGDWMHNPPPWRMPRTHADGIGGIIMLLLLGEIFLSVWMVEVEIWVITWLYYGMFLGCRKIYRSNAIGQTVATLTGRRKPERAAYDPHGAPRQPIDLAAITQPYTIGQPPGAQPQQSEDPWDTGQMRRRG